MTRIRSIVGGSSSGPQAWSSHRTSSSVRCSTLCMLSTTQRRMVSYGIGSTSWSPSRRSFSYSSFTSVGSRCARETQPGELCSEDGDEVEPEAVSDIVEHLGDDDRVERGQVPNCDVCHNGHQRMLLDVPRTGVEREAVMDSFPSLTTKSYWPGDRQPRSEGPYRESV